MVLVSVLLVALAFATVREMVLRAIPVAVALACLFTLVKADAGPVVAFGAPLLAYSSAAATQQALLNSPIRAVRFAAAAACGAASVWVAGQIAQAVGPFL